MTTELRTSEVLNKSADEIEGRGWTTGPKGMCASESGPLCLMGAIGAAAQTSVYTNYAWGLIYHYDPIEECAAGLAVRRYLGLRRQQQIYGWNDNQTDAGPVIETLRAAAVIEAAREDAALLVEASA